MIYSNIRLNFHETVPLRFDYLEKETLRNTIFLENFTAEISGQKETEMFNFLDIIKIGACVNSPSPNMVRYLQSTFTKNRVVVGRYLPFMLSVTTAYIVI